MNELAAIENRVTRLENQITAGFERVEQLLRNEISDLKSEQIKDLREANSRLADDQRRAWEAIERLRGHEQQRAGSGRSLDKLAYLAAVAFGGLVTWCATWLSAKPHP